MPWQEATKVSLRLDFVLEALDEGANIRALCRQYKISPTTGYKWIRRFEEAGPAGLKDRSRRPHNSPNQTPPEMEQKVLDLRDKRGWGGRKIKRRLEDLGVDNVPPPSTITEILRRHGRIDPEESRKREPWKRFEADAPNELVQMDFKGHFPLENGVRCHPLTILDDHSRFCLGLRACADEQRSTVKDQLTEIFCQYGLPDRLLLDNGPPWGTGQDRRRLTRLGVWLVRLGIELQHTGYYHPQTIGKDERFHRTLGDEVLSRQALRNLSHAQRCFDPWREIYNHERPHESLDLEVPASRYEKSSRRFPETLPPVMYGQGEIVRQVQDGGHISYQNRHYRVGKALHGQPVALRPTEEDGVLGVFFKHHKVEEINLRDDIDG